jgi:hypothetical protein
LDLAKIEKSAMIIQGFFGSILLHTLIFGGQHLLAYKYFGWMEMEISRIGKVLTIYSLSLQVAQCCHYYFRL